MNPLTEQKLIEAERASQDVFAEGWTDYLDRNVTGDGRVKRPYIRVTSLQRTYDAGFMLAMMNAEAGGDGSIGARQVAMEKWTERNRPIIPTPPDPVKWPHQMFPDEHPLWNTKCAGLCPTARFVGGVSNWLCECSMPLKCAGVAAAIELFVTRATEEIKSETDD